MGTDVTLAATRGPVVYVEDVGRPELAAEDRHHLQRVLRLRPGDRLVVCDGVGNWREATFGDRLAWEADAVFEERPAVSLTVSAALPKGERADWMIQKLTEIGIDTVVVMETDHSVVRRDRERAERGSARLERIVRSAAAQSRRAWLPSLRGPVPFAEAAAAPSAALAVPGAGPLPPACRNMLIGPEGGWSEAEVAVALPQVGLGPQVLRVETAALVAGTLLAALRHGVVSSPGQGKKTAFCG